jgi:hypothetical protein
MTLWEVAHELATQLARIFLRDDEGRRPCRIRGKFWKRASMRPR